MFADQCLYVNKRLNSICSSYKVIVWTKPLNLYGLVFNSLYELFEASQW